MYAYSKQVVAALVAQGTPPQMVQVGNEINDGLLWPTGSTSNFAQLAGLLKAGIAGVHAAFPPAKIVLHLAAAWDESASRLVVLARPSRGRRVSSTSSGCPTTTTGTAGSTCCRATWTGSPPSSASRPWSWRPPTRSLWQATTRPTSLSFSDPASLDPGYPASPAGQAANFRDVLSVVQAVPNGMGLGAFYWEPTWTVVKGNGWDPTDPTSGDGWENQAMWDYTDTALPVISDFAAR